MEPRPHSLVKCTVALAFAWLASAGIAHADEPTKAPSVAPPPDVAAPPADARKTKSGLSLKTIERGTGNRHPQRNDCVRIRYSAWSRDGKLVGQSSNDAQGEFQCLRRMSPGIAEAVASMVAAERTRLWIPKALAFPSTSSEVPAEKQLDLTYDLAVLAVIAAPPTPKALKGPPQSVRKLASGVAVQRLMKGRDGAKLDDRSRVRVQLSVWTTDGTLFESTLMTGQPVVFSMLELPAGLREGILQMQWGERARLWIPAALAYGDKPLRRGQPAGNLIYEVELLELVP